ncbi:hypothetical protein [Streptomyces sp. RTd22]|uniref:hypothetical protein n=1 Tax=Streptomyces sp. RTd22 TaxID=1841249 RepID=UPI0007C5D2E3|nr:hypothetical protein [Streptomyces sp. RTd22]
MELILLNQDKKPTSDAFRPLEGQADGAVTPTDNHPDGTTLTTLDNHPDSPSPLATMDNHPDSTTKKAVTADNHPDAPAPVTTMDNHPDSAGA